VIAGEAPEFCSSVKEPLWNNAIQISRPLLLAESGSASHKVEGINGIGLGNLFCVGARGSIKTYCL